MRAAWILLMMVWIAVIVAIALSSCSGLCGYHGSGCTPIDRDLQERVNQ